jgi:hypothetical protein
MTRKIRSAYDGHETLLSVFHVIDEHSRELHVPKEVHRRQFAETLCRLIRERNISQDLPNIADIVRFWDGMDDALSFREVGKLLVAWSKFRNVSPLGE